MDKELPKNWVMEKLGNLLLIERGGSPRPIEKYLTDSDEGLNWIKISDATASGKYIYKTKQKITRDGLIKTRYVKSGDFILSNSMSFGRPYIMKTDGCIHDGWLSLKDDNVKVFESEYLYYLLSSSFIFNQFDSLASGSTVRNLNKNLVASVDVKVPPLPEQERIVEKLDALFAQHEAMKKALERIPQLLKDFRQQILTQAVTGKLTEEWRKDKNLIDGDNLNIENLVNNLKTDIRTGPFGSALKKEEHQNQGVPVWGIESIGINGKFTGKNKIFVTTDKAKELKSFEVKGGNIIISRSGTVGELCILPEDIQYGLISTNLMKIVLNNEVILPIYFCWLFNASPIIIKKLNQLCKGSTRLFLTQTILKELSFPTPSIDEQKEIVILVENLFAKADIIEERYKTLKEKIDSLPQAILNKAFKGELVPQLPTDGDAKDLLEEILKLKKEVKKK